MEQLPAWLEATVTAAGMAIVYIADDWERFGNQPGRSTYEDDIPPTPETPH
jgi:hypothetical protein